MQLTGKQKRMLRGLAQRTQAALQVGRQGLTPTLLAEIEVALDRDELVKVKLREEDRKVRDALCAEIAEKAGCAFVQRVGGAASFYRAPTKRPPQIILPSGPDADDDGE